MALPVTSSASGGNVSVAAFFGGKHSASKGPSGARKLYTFFCRLPIKSRIIRNASETRLDFIRAKPVGFLTAFQLAAVSRVNK